MAMRCSIILNHCVLIQDSHCKSIYEIIFVHFVEREHFPRNQNKWEFAIVL